MEDVLGVYVDVARAFLEETLDEALRDTFLLTIL